jgi:hypothetical protein
MTPFEARVVVLARERAYDRAEWADALVLVHRGTVELVGVSGERRRFGPGAMLWLDGVPLQQIGNGGPEPAVLIAIARRSGRDPAGSAADRRCST